MLSDSRAWLEMPRACDKHGSYLTICYRSLDQFIFRNQIGAGHASIVYLVRDTVAEANLALKCYPGAAAKPDVRVQV